MFNPETRLQSLAHGILQVPDAPRLAIEWTISPILPNCLGSAFPSSVLGHKSAQSPRLGSADLVRVVCARGVEFFSSSSEYSVRQSTKQPVITVHQQNIFFYASG